MSLLDQEPRSAKAITNGETILLKIEQRGFFELMAGKIIIVVINNEEIYEKEGCLSFPHLFMPVLRAETIGVKFQLKDGTEQFGSFGGLLSIIFQHEMEHMEGELFIDNVSDFKLKSAMKKRKILKRKAERKQRNG